MSMSIYDLVYDYINVFYEGVKLNKEQKKTIHLEMKRLLKNGWCSSELSSGFRTAKKKRPEWRALEVSKLFNVKKPQVRNLLKPQVFYYHNELRLTSAPPKREIDYDLGEVRIINEPYFLEMKASYNINDLIDYYIRQVDRDHGNKQRLAGSFGWLLKHYTVEQILFMIDVTVNMCEAEDLSLPQSPLDIQKYFDDAKELIVLKKTDTVEAGGKEIVRKKRFRTS